MGTPFSTNYIFQCALCYSRDLKNPIVSLKKFAKQQDSLPSLPLCKKCGSDQILIVFIRSTIMHEHTVTEILLSTILNSRSIQPCGYFSLERTGPLHLLWPEAAKTFKSSVYQAVKVVGKTPILLRRLQDSFYKKDELGCFWTFDHFPLRGKKETEHFMTNQSSDVIGKWEDTKNPCRMLVPPNLYLYLGVPEEAYLSPSIDANATVSIPDQKDKEGYSYREPIQIFIPSQVAAACWEANSTFSVSTICQNPNAVFALAFLNQQKYWLLFWKQWNQKVQVRKKKPSFRKHG